MMDTYCDENTVADLQTELSNHTEHHTSMDPVTSSAYVSREPAEYIPEQEPVTSFVHMSRETAVYIPEQEPATSCVHMSRESSGCITGLGPVTLMVGNNDINLNNTSVGSKDIRFSNDRKGNFDYFGSESSMFNLHDSISNSQEGQNGVCNISLADSRQLTNLQVDNDHDNSQEDIDMLEIIADAEVVTTVVVTDPEDMTVSDDHLVQELIIAAESAETATTHLGECNVKSTEKLLGKRKRQKLKVESSLSKCNNAMKTGMKFKKSQAMNYGKSKSPCHVKSSYGKSNSIAKTKSENKFKKKPSVESKPQKKSSTKSEKCQSNSKLSAAKSKFKSKTVKSDAKTIKVKKSLLEIHSQVKNAKVKAKKEKDSKMLYDNKSLYKNFATALTVHEESPEERKKRQLLRILQYKEKYLTKPCTVYLQKLEKMDLNKEALTVDMTFPETFPECRLQRRIPRVNKISGVRYRPQQCAVLGEPQVDKKKATKFDMPKYKAYLREKAKGNINSSSNVYKASFPLVTASIVSDGGDAKAVNNVHAEGINSTVDGRTTLSGAAASKQNVPLTESQDNSHTLIVEEIEEGSLMLFDDDDYYGGQSTDNSSASDDDDDYRPNCDYGYKPKKKKHKKFRLSKKFKPNPFDYYLKCKAEEAKVKIEPETLNSVKEPTASTSKPKVYVKKRKRTCRIGRPPVLGHFECKLCEFTACEKNLVEKHHAVAHVHPWVQCGFCTAKFRSKNVLLEHEARKHTNEKPFKCQHEGCEYASKCLTDLVRHQSKHAKEKKHVCNLCGWTTRWVRNLRSHHVMKHSTERKYKCDQCSFTAKRTSDLKQHMYRHSSEKPIKCDICGFCVKTNWEIRSHMLKHSDDKPFKCKLPGCNASSKTNADLTKHMRVHATTRPFKCDLCLKTFKDHSSLQKHKAFMHVKTKDFKCHLCDMAFKIKYALRKHIDTHSGIRPFKCDVCNMRFANQSNKRFHMKTHDTSTRPFPCPICPYSARIQHHLLAHIGTMHGDTYTYFCELCRKPFKRYGRLQVHYSRMHSQREIDSLNGGQTEQGQADIALKTMEMKLDPDVVEYQSRKSRNGKRALFVETNEVCIKQEPADDLEYTIEINRETSEKDSPGINRVTLDKNNTTLEISKAIPSISPVVPEVSRAIPEVNQAIPEISQVIPEINRVASEINETTTDVNVDTPGNNLSVDIKMALRQISDHETAFKDKQDDLSKSCAVEHMDLTADPSQNVNEESKLKSIALNENRTCQAMPAGERYDADSSNVAEVSSEDILPRITKVVSQVAVANESTPRSYLTHELNSDNDRPLATLALYNGLRLPLATKGFAFNYDKNGKKPKAWFMNIDYMDAESAAKMKAYLRRKGLMSPLPKGKKKKKSGLTAFVQDRKRKLHESIRMSNLQKQTALKANEGRKARFMGSYTELETGVVEDLTSDEVEGRLSSSDDEKMSSNASANTSKSKTKVALGQFLSNKSGAVVEDMTSDEVEGRLAASDDEKMASNPTADESRSRTKMALAQFLSNKSKKGATSSKYKIQFVGDRSNKGSGKQPVQQNGVQKGKKSNKLLLSSEKKAEKAKQKRKTKAPIVIRIPTYLQSQESHNPKSSAKVQKSKNNKSKGKNGKKTTEKCNAKGVKKKVHQEQNSDKPEQGYRRKYVPAKKRQKNHKKTDTVNQAVCLLGKTNANSDMYKGNMSRDVDQTLLNQKPVDQDMIGKDDSLGLGDDIKQEPACET